MENKFTLSVIVITKNEADRLERCLASIKALADEIIIYDSGSQDNTLEIAARYTHKIFQTDWPGYGPQKQRALSSARCDWVLSIDADEVVSPELAREIVEVLNQDPREVAFRIPWSVINFGKRLDHGNSARSVKRLFRREGARFTNAIVHEAVLLPPGSHVGKLKNRLIHYSIRDFEHYLIKNRTYSWLGAQKRFDVGKRGWGLPGAVFRAFWVFFRCYVIRRGFLDGQVGFLVAAMYSQGAFNKYAGLWSLQRMARLNANLPQDPNGPKRQ
ncbi:MAG: glycosyltransferase family 2 protein [Desulfobacterium sp.]